MRGMKETIWNFQFPEMTSCSLAPSLRPSWFIPHININDDTSLPIDGSVMKTGNAINTGVAVE